MGLVSRWTRFRLWINRALSITTCMYQYGAVCGMNTTRGLPTASPASFLCILQAGGCLILCFASWLHLML